MKKYHLILSLDYELFGDGSGCIDKCLIEPTDRCRSIVESHNACLSLFVEALEFSCFKHQPPCNLLDSYHLIEQQLASLSSSNHRLEMHLHPQWLEAQLEESKWTLALEKWRVGNLSDVDQQRSIATAYNYLNELECLDTPALRAFRAGGWTIQPSGNLFQRLGEFGVTIDSTAAPGMFNHAKGDWYDFRNCPNKPFWNISDDVCTEDEQGHTVEVPITTGKLGKSAHVKALLESRAFDSFPADCTGSYAGPNNGTQSLIGKFSKIRSIGNVMLDFSTLPAWAMIQLTESYMERFKDETDPVPIVAIGHNKNFSEQSENNLNEFLAWAGSCNEMIFSDYRAWYESLRMQKQHLA